MSEQAEQDKVTFSFSTRTFRIILLFLTSVLLILFLFAVFRFYQGLNSRISELEAEVQGYSSNSIQPSSLSDEDYALVDSRLRTLENLQEAIVNSSKSAVEQLNFVFAIVAAFFGVFSVFIAYRQISMDTNRQRLDEEMRSLVSSFHQNITVINSLIDTLEKSYSYRDQVEVRIQTLDRQLIDIEHFKKVSEKNLDTRTREVNQKAYGLFRKDGDRELFKREEAKTRLRGFTAEMNTLIQMGASESELNPFCYYVRALHLFNETQYVPAGQDLEEARKKARKELRPPGLNLFYGDSLADDITKKLKFMLDECHFHLGIIYYNTGKYRISRERFNEAFSGRPDDYRSRIYIPELMFFEGDASFEQVMDEFSRVEAELQGLDVNEIATPRWETAMASLKMRQGNCYLAKLFKLTRRSIHEIFENQERAAELYWQAYEHAEKSQEDSLTKVFVYFSLAQALSSLSRSEWKSTTPTKLYEFAYQKLMHIVPNKTEPIILVLLNYSIAIAANGSGIPGDTPHYYLSRAREHLQHVPSYVRIFSPITKILLKQEEYMEEIQKYERSLRGSLVKI